jgi:hypothetical protein
MTRSLPNTSPERAPKVPRARPLDRFLKPLLLLVLLGGVAGVTVLLISEWSRAHRLEAARNVTEAFTSEPAGASEFASDRAGASALKQIPLDGKRAMRYLKDVCDIGPRMSGTAGMRKQQDLLENHFRKLGGTVERQTFQGKQKSRANAVEMTNLIVSWHPDRKRRIILCSHYDTRPVADQEEDPRRWHETFLSANDGGSGVALLMELAHHMKDLPTNVGVDFVFFDGEEYVWEKGDDYFLGSRHFAAAWAKNKRQPDYKAAVLLDMIAGKNAKFTVEELSWRGAPQLVQALWIIARDQGCTAFVWSRGSKRWPEGVLDDHTELLKVGLPAIDIIDHDYLHWHRLADVPANCSADALLQVGRVLTVWVQRMK